MVVGLRLKRRKGPFRQSFGMQDILGLVRQPTSSSLVDLLEVYEEERNPADRIHQATHSLRIRQATHSLQICDTSRNVCHIIGVWLRAIDSGRAVRHVRNLGVSVWFGLPSTR
ncbi:hypothetical protein BDZ89DRAFT_1083110 [Hymenopellis radicata]|nr:hypothetical protein BDZ89DRAFT_1083110 [Hymenopellis radicata]